MGGEDEGDGVLVVFVGWVGEVRACGGGVSGETWGEWVSGVAGRRKRGRDTAVILNSDGEGGGAVGGGDVGGGRGVYGDESVGGGVVGGAGGDAKEVFVGHWGGGLGIMRVGVGVHSV